MDNNFLTLEGSLKYTFKDKDLLKRALIHKSYGNEHKAYKNVNNEKMELLGDAVLDLIITEYLYKKYPYAHEGELSKTKAMVVSEPVLAKLAGELKIGEYLQMGNGEEKTGGRKRDSLPCDSFESVLGAIFIDSNYNAAKKYVLMHMKDVVDNVEKNEDIIDYKTILQEFVQHKFRVIPEYAVLLDEGPSNDKYFEIIVGVLSPERSGHNIRGEELKKAILAAKYKAKGSGKNKKIAEQKAAKELCKKLGVKKYETL